MKKYFKFKPKIYPFLVIGTLFAGGGVKGQCPVSSGSVICTSATAFGTAISAGSSDIVIPSGNNLVFSNNGTYNLLADLTITIQDGASLVYDGLGSGVLTNNCLSPNGFWGGFLCNGGKLTLRNLTIKHSQSAIQSNLSLVGSAILQNINIENCIFENNINTINILGFAYKYIRISNSTLFWDDNYKPYFALTTPNKKTFLFPKHVLINGGTNYISTQSEYRNDVTLINDIRYDNRGTGIEIINGNLYLGKEWCTGEIFTDNTELVCPELCGNANLFKYLTFGVSSNDNFLHSLDIQDNLFYTTTFGISCRNDLKSFIHKNEFNWIGTTNDEDAGLGISMNESRNYTISENIFNASLDHDAFIGVELFDCDNELPGCNLQTFDSKIYKNNFTFFGNTHDVCANLNLFNVVGTCAIDIFRYNLGAQIECNNINISVQKGLCKYSEVADIMVTGSMLLPEICYPLSIDQDWGTVGIDAGNTFTNYTLPSISKNFLFNTNSPPITNTFVYNFNSSRANSLPTLNPFASYVFMVLNDVASGTNPGMLNPCSQGQQCKHYKGGTNPPSERVEVLANKKHSTTNFSTIKTFNIQEFEEFKKLNTLLNLYDFTGKNIPLTNLPILFQGIYFTIFKNSKNEIQTQKIFIFE